MTVKHRVAEVYTASMIGAGRVKAADYPWQSLPLADGVGCCCHSLNGGHRFQSDCPRRFSRCDRKAAADPGARAAFERDVELKLTMRNRLELWMSSRFMMVERCARTNRARSCRAVSSARGRSRDHACQLHAEFRVIALFEPAADPGP